MGMGEGAASENPISADKKGEINNSGWVDPYPVTRWAGISLGVAAKPLALSHSPIISDY